MDPPKREALETIIRDSERLKALAKEAGEDFLAFQFEQALHEARAVLIGSGGGGPRPPATPKVLPFKR